MFARFKYGCLEAMKRLSLSCLWLLLSGAILLVPLPARAQEFAARSHKVAEGDSIRGLLLKYGCVSSMLDYSRAREAFGKLNPGLFHSALLTPGATVQVPESKPGKGERCLPFEELRIVRVDFETTPGAEHVRIHLDGPVLPDVFVLKQTPPVRVVCDFDGTLPQAGLVREMPVEGRIVRKIRIGHEDKPFKRARVVMEVEESLAGRIEQEFFEKESLFVVTVFEGAPN